MKDYPEEVIEIAATAMSMGILLFEYEEEDLIDRLQGLLDKGDTPTLKLFKKVEQKLAGHEAYELANVIKTFINYNF